MLILLRVLRKKFINLIYKISDFLLMIFGCISVMSVLYNRLRYRIPKTLPIVLSPENVIIYIILISTIIFILCLNFCILFRKEATKSENIYLSLIIENYHKGIDKLFNTIEYILNYWFKKTIKDFCTKIFDKFVQSNNNYKKYVIIIEIFPRCVILCFFIMDIVYFKKLHYFYISLLLFMLPLTTKCVFYVIQRIFNDIIDNLNTKLDVYMDECNVSNDLLPPMSIKYYFEQKILYSLEKRKNIIKYNIKEITANVTEEILKKT